MKRMQGLRRDWNGGWLPVLAALVGVTVGGLAGVTGAGVAAAADEAPAETVGVQWRDLTIEQAIAEAKAKDTMVLVDVWDSHCMACGELDTDVWNTPDGVAIADGLIPIQVQSTVDAGRAFMKLYPVTGLPAIIFIQPDGTELDRVEGYYGNRNVFLDAVRPLRNGIDPLKTMETKLQASPDSLPLLLGVMEKYLFRKREKEAAAVFQRIQQLDPQNAKRSAERSMQIMARFEENWRNDYPKAAEYYKQMVERFPDSPSAGGNADNVFKALYRTGRSAEWKDWVCPLLDKYPNNLSLQRSAVLTAFNWHQRGDCFARAARQAAKLKAPKPAWFDSVAVILEGGPPTPKK